ncbi:MAG: IS110 family transposase [Geobacteraceae bacterium]|nr:IS110 family transposase [Geobacteraceae bacterium]
MKQTTREVEYTTEPSLYLAFELGKAKWKLALSTGLGQNPRLRTVDAGDLTALEEEIRQAKRRFHLPELVVVRSCYEAGRDGFWLHRYLVQKRVQNLVVDSSSIEVNRRARRVKTDRLDATKLTTMLIRYHSGEEKVWSVVQVPTVEAEDMRHLHRQLSSLQVARTRHICRIGGLLASQGVNVPIHADFLSTLPSVRLWDGSPLPPGVRARVEREHAALQYVRQQIKELVVERDKLIETSDKPSIQQVRQLMKLVAMGPNSAWLFVMEFFAWRQFRNRREVGGLAGLTPTPYQSGGESREQGISKAGNRPVRAMAIEIAWCWLRYQPDSELARWYYEHFGQGGKRMRKVGIVALARKLLVALWRYLETGEIPEGAQLKP